jgi:hypothetical protein
MNKKHTQWFWFIGGFALGFTLIAIGHAALPKKTSALSELRTSKVAAPEMDQEFVKLTSLESRYAESADQQKRLKTATNRNTRRARN